MNAAPAPPAASSEALPLPAAFAAALDADGSVRVRHPATGAVFRLAPTDADANEREPTPEEQAELDGRQTDLEAIREGLEQANAGNLMSLAEFRTEMTARHPRLAARRTENR